MGFFDPRIDGRTSDSTVQEVDIKTASRKGTDTILCCASHTLIFMGPKKSSFDSTWWGSLSCGVAEVFLAQLGGKRECWMLRIAP